MQQSSSKVHGWWMVMAWPSSCSSFSCFFASWPVQWSSHGHRRHRRSEVGIAGHNPTLLRPNAQRLHSGLQRFRLLLAEGKRGNPLFEVVETWKFIEVSLIHSTYSRQLDKSKHMQTARHKLLIWFKQNHYVVVARFFISTPYTWLFSQLSSKWRDQTYRVMV